MMADKYQGPQLDAAQVNALLQARGTGKVGAILANAGQPTKSGNRCLHMMRGFVADGILSEGIVVDEGTKTIVYFHLVPGADLRYLDEAALIVIRAFAENQQKIGGNLTEITEAHDQLEKHLVDLQGLLKTLGTAMKEVRATAQGIQELVTAGDKNGWDAGGNEAALWAAGQEAGKIETMMAELMK